MVSFRTAAPADAAALVPFVNGGYRGESSKKGWTTEADILGGQRTDPGKMREMIAEKEYALLVRLQAVKRTQEPRDPEGTLASASR